MSTSATLPTFASLLPAAGDLQELDNDTMRLPSYRSSHGRRHHPYPSNKRTTRRRTLPPSLFYREDEVSERVWVPVSQFDPALDEALSLSPVDNKSPRRPASLSSLVADLALLLRRKYFG